MVCVGCQRSAGVLVRQLWQIACVSAKRQSRAWLAVQKAFGLLCAAKLLRAKPWQNLRRLSGCPASSSIIANAHDGSYARIAADDRTEPLVPIQQVKRQISLRMAHTANVRSAPTRLCDLAGVPFNHDASKHRSCSSLTYYSSGTANVYGRCSWQAAFYRSFDVWRGKAPLLCFEILQSAPANTVAYRILTTLPESCCSTVHRHEGGRVLGC